MTKKILIAGASVYGLQNISDDAMLYSYLAEFKKKYDVEFNLICRHIPNYLEAYPINNFIQNLDFPSKKLSSGKRFYGLNNNDEVNHLKNILTELQNSNLLIIGGDPFIDITLEDYRGLLPYVEILVLLAKFSGIPVLLHGIHFGRPPTTKVGVDKMNFILDNVTAITTRAQSAIDFLSSYRPSMNRIDLLHTDDAYGLQIPSKADSNADRCQELFQWIRNQKIQGRFTVLVTVRTLYWIWDDKQRTTFLDLIGQFLAKIQKKYNLSIIFLPHCTYDMDDIWEDDRLSHSKLFEKINRHQSYRIEDRIDVSNILPIFQAVDMAIGNRRHTGIFSGLCLKPFLLFGEKGHVAPVYKDLGIEYDFIDYDDLNLDDLIKSFEQIYHDKDFVQNYKSRIELKKRAFSEGIAKISKIF